MPVDGRSGGCAAEALEAGMDSAWFEEDLVPSPATIATTMAQVKTLLPGMEEELRRAAHGIVRVDRPRWREVSSAAFVPLAPGARFYVIRLGFQFDVPHTANRTRFTFARCQAYLYPGATGQPQPRVYAVIPQRLEQGEPQRVSLKLEPTIHLEPIEISLGEISTDLTVGVIEPVVVGFPGEDERAPYWDVRPQGTALLGV